MLRFKCEDVKRKHGLALRTVEISSTTDAKRWTVFVGVPESYSHLVSSENDVFLPLIMMFGLLRGECVDFGGVQVDEIFLRNASGALRHYAAWYPKLVFVPPTGASLTSGSKPSANAAASFYSGGIDSLFSLVRHSQGRHAEPGSAIDQDVEFALHIFHRDQPTDPNNLIAESKTLMEGAQRLGVQFVPVISNIMFFDQAWHDSWGGLTHGAALATVMHFSSQSVKRGIVGSSHSYGRLPAWGSSPITDPLWSSPWMKVVHDGSTFTRVEKTEVICRHSSALAAINVCDKLIPGLGYVNCSRCQKCLRTMTAIDLFGRASASLCPSFDWSAYTPHEFGRMYLRNASEITFAHELADASREMRPDIFASAAAAIHRSRSWKLRSLAKVESVVKMSSFGKRYRGLAKAPRGRIYQLLAVRR